MGSNGASMARVRVRVLERQFVYHVANLAWQAEGVPERGVCLEVMPKVS
jgi:hypothetical protein